MDVFAIGMTAVCVLAGISSLPGVPLDGLLALGDQFVRAAATRTEYAFTTFLIVDHGPLSCACQTFHQYVCEPLRAHAGRGGAFDRAWQLWVEHADVVLMGNTGGVPSTRPRARGVTADDLDVFVAKLRAIH
jgi:hypothetical protein